MAHRPRLPKYLDLAERILGDPLLMAFLLGFFVGLVAVAVLIVIGVPAPDISGLAD